MQTTNPIISPAITTPTGAAAIKEQRLKEACRDFESILVGYMLKSMRKASYQSDLIEKNMGERVFTDMLDEEYSKLASRTSKFGLADVMYRQLSQKGRGMEEIGKAMQMYQQSSAQSKVPITNFQVMETRQRQESMDPALVRRIASYNSSILGAARQNRLSPELLRAVIAQESRGFSHAVSPARAKGLMQLIDSTAREMGVEDSFDPKQNIYGGARYLRAMLDRFGEDLEKALAAYNAGPGAVEKYKGIPPYAETQDYVKNVLEYLRQFQGRNGG